MLPPRSAAAHSGRAIATAVVTGEAGDPYDATGRDRPRRAGLALHLGAILDLPTVGVTHRPLLAEGDRPRAERGAQCPLRLGEEIVAYWLRARAGTRPLAVHAAWRTDSDTAVAVALASLGRSRTREPLRAARLRARTARAD
jgi:deoxyribonuclease V